MRTIVIDAHDKETGEVVQLECSIDEETGHINPRIIGGTDAPAEPPAGELEPNPGNFGSDAPAPAADSGE